MSFTLFYMASKTPQAVTAAARRSNLAARCSDDSPPGIWRVAAAAEGVLPGADAYLCHRSRSITAALENLAASAEAARARLLSVRQAFRDVSQPYCDELEVHVTSAESSKRAALELELCAVDAALESLRADRGAAAEAAASLCDTDLMTRYPEALARLKAAGAMLLALPTSVVEPPCVGLFIDEPALLAGRADFGRVVAPQAVTAGDLTLQSAPRNAWPGGAVRLCLALQGPSHASQSAEELEVSLGAAAAALHAEVSLVTPGVGVHQPLKIAVSADVPGRSVVVTIAVPAFTVVGSSLYFGPLAISGQAVDARVGALLVKVCGLSWAKPLQTRALLVRSPVTRPGRSFARARGPTASLAPRRRLELPRRLGRGISRHEPRLRRY